MSKTAKGYRLTPKRQKFARAVVQTGELTAAYIQAYDTKNMKRKRLKTIQPTH